jgi:hypothetical protein
MSNPTPDYVSMISRLSQVRAHDYFKNRAMPSFVEPLLEELLELVETSPQVLRQQLLASVTIELSSVLGWYARKLAGRAVRDHSIRDLRHGLLAIAVRLAKDDPRESLAPLSLLYNSSLLLDQDPVALFPQIVEKSTPAASAFFTNFLRRPPEIRSIAPFGFREGTGPHGFDYIPLLPEFGGPTPF